jgi:hypothetical protein
MVGHLTAASAALLARLPEAVLQSDSGDNTLGYLVFFGIGLILVYNGFTKWQQMRLIQDTPTEKVRSAAVGRTELSGTGKPIEEQGTIERPFTDGECLVAVYRVEEWEEDHDHDHDHDDHGRDGHWETVDSGTLYVPFEIDDGTGTMRVEPEADATYEISDEFQTTFRVGAGQTPPGEVADFFERQYEDDDDDGLLGGILGGGPDARGHDKRRYVEEVLPPGEDLYLLGSAEPVEGASGSNADRLVLGRDEGSEEFIISDKSEDELVSNYKWSAPAQIIGGIALSAAMLYLILG